MGLLIPSAAQGRNLDQIFMTAPFKDFDIESHMQIHQRSYKNERGTIKESEGTFCRTRRLKEHLKI
jgi:hypothetical protein